MGRELRVADAGSRHRSGGTASSPPDPASEPGGLDARAPMGEKTGEGLVDFATLERDGKARVAA